MATNSPQYTPLQPTGEPSVSEPQGGEEEPPDRLNESLERLYKVFEPLLRFLGPVTKIARLLTAGYASEDAQRRLERRADWGRFRKVLMIKLQNIGVVRKYEPSVHGPNSTNDIRNLSSIYLHEPHVNYIRIALLMVHRRSAPIPPSSKSCPVLANQTTQSPQYAQQELSKQTILFYYLNSTPSLFGGASALAFFVAVGAWVWLETDQGIVSRVLVILLGAALMGNAGACFVLGAADWGEESEKD
ncbi:hypothetical protein FRC10_007853 [Ceratobasidium sp. 414]|nr:hypothetical protein FRC10_007853 [Ceratobasidium sp. 414]